jgi:hypothetical protein
MQRHAARCATVSDVEEGWILSVKDRILEIFNLGESSK